jgi:hypothetical protein
MIKMNKKTEKTQENEENTLPIYNSFEITLLEGNMVLNNKIDVLIEELKLLRDLVSKLVPEEVIEVEEPQ